MSKYEAVYFVGDNRAINQVWVDSSKTRNRGAFSGSVAALVSIHNLQKDQANQSTFRLQMWLMFLTNENHCYCLATNYRHQKI